MKVNLKDYLGGAAEVLRSSERMVQSNVDYWRETPEDEYYDPDWDVHITQDEAKILMQNLKNAAALFDILSKNYDAARDLLEAHNIAREARA